MKSMTMNNCHKCATPPRAAGTRNQLEERRDQSGLSRSGTRSRPREHQRDFETMADSRSMPPKARKTKDVTGNTCTICGREGNLVCPCQTTRYCSKECQAVDWKDRGHKKACRKIRAEREEEAKRSEAPTPPSSPTPVFYGPAERTHADEVRARIKAEHEAARVEREANPKPEPIVTSERYGKACPICLEEWDVTKWSQTEQIFQACCAKTVCKSCSQKTRFRPCPLCRAPWPKTAADYLANLRRHADNDVAEAIGALGRGYITGDIGLKISEKKGMRLLERAADLGDVEAMLRVSLAYQDGDLGAKVDKLKAMRVCRPAAERGYALAQFSLAGFLIEADEFEESLALVQQAAEQGLAVAQFELGMYYERGYGVSKDLDEARRWYERGAAQGLEEAKTHLAELPAPGKKAPRRRRRKRRGLRASSPHSP